MIRFTRASRRRRFTRTLNCCPIRRLTIPPPPSPVKREFQLFSRLFFACTLADGGAPPLTNDDGRDGHIPPSSFFILHLHSSSFILHPSSFILHSSSSFFILHPSSFILHFSFFIFHSSFGLPRGEGHDKVTPPRCTRPEGRVTRGEIVRELTGVSSDVCKPTSPRILPGREAW